MPPYFEESSLAAIADGVDSVLVETSRGGNGSIVVDAVTAVDSPAKIRRFRLFVCLYYPYIALRPYMDQAIVLAYHISDPG